MDASSGRSKGLLDVRSESESTCTFYRKTLRVINGAEPQDSKKDSTFKAFEFSSLDGGVVSGVNTEVVLFHSLGQNPLVGRGE